MDNENGNTSDNKNQLENEYKNIAKNTFYVIINSYGTFILTFVSAFLIARMISLEDWGLVILANSLIGILITFSYLIPPGLIFSMNFYIPRYRAKNELVKLRIFILKAFVFRILSSIALFLIGLAIFSVFGNLFNDYLHNHLSLVFILIPLVIITSLDTFFLTILLGFNLFKYHLVLLLIKSATNIIPILWIFFTSQMISVETFALINLFSALVPLIFSILIVMIKFPKDKSGSEVTYNNKKFLKKVITYGGFLRFESFTGQLWTETQTQSIGVFEDSEWVTGFQVTKYFTSFSAIFLSSLNAPLLYSLSSLDYKQNIDYIKDLFSTIFIYSTFLYMLITGIFFLITDFFLVFVFGPDYLQFSILIQLVLIGNIVSIYGSFYIILLRTTNRIKQLSIILIIALPLQIFFFFFGLILFGVVGMVVFEIIHRIIWAIIYFYLSVKKLKINLNISRIILNYGIFIFSLLTSIFLGILIFNEITSQFWINIGLSIFRELDFFTILTFIILFLGLSIILKSITKDDIEKLESFFNKESISNKIVKRGLTFLKKFLRRS